MTRARLAGWGLIGVAGLLAACSSGGSPSTNPPPSGGEWNGIGDGTMPGDSAGGDSGGSGGATGAAPPSAGDGPGTSGGSGASGDDDDSSGSASGDDTGTSSGTGGNGSVPADVLTAGSWDDNRNYDLFKTYLGANSQLAGRPPIADSEFDSAYSLWSAPRTAKTTLDVSLVLDTTGSMGDEIAYLSSEFLALHASIEAKYPNADQRWSLVAYKDIHDPYIVQWFDFRTDPNDFVSHLSELSASGGDDYPESPERALEIASQLAWRGDSTAKLAFWISDAPHHDQDAAVMAKSIRDLNARGVHMYPVMASGADDLTELTMRMSAELTGGRLLFLTDDSGVGNSHAEPRIPCYFVTKLDKAVSRMVDIELSGTYREPDAADVLRTGGNPQSGRCKLSNGQEVSVF